MSMGRVESGFFFILKHHNGSFHQLCDAERRLARLSVSCPFYTYTSHVGEK